VVKLLLCQDQFSGMGLAQQIVLTVMLDNDTAFCPEETFAVYPAIAGLRLWRGRRLACGKICVRRCHSVKNSNQFSNDNHYQQNKARSNPFCEK
jgi:hypothetical protein